MQPGTLLHSGGVQPGPRCSLQPGPRWRFVQTFRPPPGLQRTARQGLQQKVRCPSAACQAHRSRNKARAASWQRAAGATQLDVLYSRNAIVACPCAAACDPPPRAEPAPKVNVLARL